MDQAIPMGDMRPHEYTGMVGLIGGSCNRCGRVAGDPIHSVITPASEPKDYDAVEPPHYKRGPRIHMEEGVQEGDWYDVQCIDVMREIKDPRLATALKYIWRVAFGGKSEPWDSRTPVEVDARDINSAVWYLRDYLANPPEPLADSPQAGYDALVRRLKKAEQELESRPVKVVETVVEPKNSGIDID